MLNAMEPRRKRARDAGSDRRRRIAMAIAAKNKAKWPYTSYGVAHMQRGAPHTRQLFGETFRSANADQRSNRRNFGYSGRGLYTGHGAYWGRAAGAALGGMLGSRAGLGAAGSAIGGWLGDKGSDWLESKMKGRGLYVGDAHHGNNLIMGSGTSIPAFSGSGDETGAVIISHREYITDVYGPPSGTAFYNQSYPINPALGQSFPWLSQIAANYDEYEFIQLIYTYRSTTTDIGNTTNGQCGTIVMATNYNAAVSPFTDKQQMVEYAHAHSCKLTEHMSHGVECDPRKTALASTLYTRTNPTITGQDLKTYDHGLFQFALCNCPAGYANFPVGELWVEYKVALRKPKLYVTRGYEIDVDYYTTPASGLAPSAGPGIFNATSGLYGNLLKCQQSNIGGIVYCGDYSSSLVLTAKKNTLTYVFPAGVAGNFRVIACQSPAIALAGANLGAPTVTVGGNVTFLPTYDSQASLDSYGLTGGILTPLTVGAGLGCVSIYDFNVQIATNGVNNIVHIYFAVEATGASSVTSAVNAWFRIEQINNLNVSGTQQPVFIKPSNNAVTIP